MCLGFQLDIISYSHS
uniref:Uncharacterized protein n=1 Tax=Lepeophtheirus salmonis TaxID=72036 RepID=A0A0K2U4T2_LEPSM